MVNRALTLDGTAMVVLTAAEYRALTEDAGDAALAHSAKREDASAPTLDAATLREVLAGKLHPLTAWRQAAGLSQRALAAKAGIRTATLSNIEGDKIDPRLSTLKAVAAVLGLDVDDIVR